MLTDYPTRSHWLLYFVLYTLLILLVPKGGQVGDVRCWVDWATHMGAHGLTRGYEVDSNNYNPLYQYVLFGYSKLAGGPDRIFRYRHMLKMLTLLFDFAGAIIAVRKFGWGDANQRFILSLLFLLNVGYLYNTVGWEQVDAILGTLAFAAVVQALRQRTASSMVLFMLTVNMKTQGIIFLPPLLLLWVPQWWQSPRRLGYGLVLASAGQLLILLPYILAGKLWEVIDIVRNAVGFYPNTSLNCFNLWVWLLDPYEQLDTQLAGGLTYNQWGLLSFMLAAAIVLLPLGLVMLQKLRERAVFGAAEYRLALLSLGLIPLVFCFFNTQMHERYWHPALLFLGAYGLLTRRYFLFCLFSVAYFLNLEYVFQFQLPPGKVHTTVLFWPRVITTMFATVLVVGIWQLYRHANLRATWQQVRRPQRPVAAAATVATLA